MKNNQLLKIERLDQALLLWEEMMWSFGIIRQACVGVRISERESWPPLAGPVVHYKEFRRHLLTMDSLEEFDIERFQITPKEDALWRNFVNYFIFPGQLAAWTHASRRVYQVDADLKAILGATSLEGLTIGDIHFPFEAFGISLDEPIEGNDGELFDFILYAPMVQRIDGELRKFPAIRLLNTKFANVRSIPREAIDKKMARGRVQEAEEILTRKSNMTKVSNLDTLVVTGATEACTIQEMIGSFRQSQSVQGWRIVFGLMLYLKMMADANAQAYTWQAAPQKAKMPLSYDKRSITDGASVCSVTSVRQLSREERTALNHFAQGGVASREMPFHFREGHWRRPPGKGNDPTWPKTVLVQPTVVRKDRKPDDAIAGGSFVSVK